MRKLIVIFLSIVIPSLGFAQKEKELALYRHLLSVVKDSAFASHRASPVLADETGAEELDKQHPNVFFRKALEAMAKHDYDRATFLLLLGRARAAYHHAINPGYKANDDGALTASLAAIAGEPLQVYRMGSVGNYIAISKQVLAYLGTHREVYKSLGSDPGRYAAMEKRMQESIALLEQDREKYADEYRTALQEIAGALEKIDRDPKEDD